MAKAWRPVMSGDRSLMAAVRLYLAERRALGYELAAPGTELMRFARYADARGHHGPLTSELIVGWARDHVKRTTEVTAARRLEIVRPFAAYYRQFEPATEIPPVGLLGRGHRRLVPHIYSDDEGVQLLQAASRLTPRNALRPLTYRALFDLIAAARLRLSEALNLTNGDVDLAAGSITVRQTKFPKSRCLPLHSSVVQALSGYRQARDRPLDTRPEAPFFASSSGAALPKGTVDNVFRRLRPHLGWFPISEDANFFAHYDVLVQRPPTNTIATALDYYYFFDRSGIRNNPNLKPERTIDYEVGFKQKLTNASALTITAYYKEMRDMIPSRVFFPLPIINQYETYDNLDFGTVKGFSFVFDQRRSGNFSMNANYTLQFADGTGSDANSNRAISSRGVLRTLFPLNFDERHRMVISADYRYDSGKRYTGPRLFGMDIFADAGVNFQAIAVSGRPYTRKFLPTELGGEGTIGAINGARNPWNFTVYLRVDKNFNIGDQLSVNIYCRVSNLLDRRNIIGVYPATGSATEDGFIRSAFGQNQITTVQNSLREVDAYLASYQWALLNPGNYSLPRRIFVGAIFDF